MRLTLYLLLIAIPQSFAAEDCDPIRLDEPGGSMEHVPVLDQGELPLCSMAAAAQALDAWRFSHGDKNYQTKTSFTHLALKYPDIFRRIFIAKAYRTPSF